MVRAMEFRSDQSGFCALPPCFKIVIMPFLLPQFLLSYIQQHAVLSLATSCWEPLAQEDQFYQYQKVILGAIHSTKLSGNFGPKLNGSVRSNRKSFEKTGPPFEVVLFFRSDQSEFWSNGSRPLHNSGCFSKAVPAHDCQLSKGLPFYLTDLTVVSCFEG